MFKYLLILCVIPTITFANVVDPEPIAPPTGLVPAGLIKPGANNYYPSTTIIADKSRRTLSVWKNSNNKIELLDFYSMDHGKKNGNKQVQGDLKTPEGIYFVQDKKSARELEYNEYGIMAFTLNYPNHFDHMNRKTGGGIWLHSIPPHKTLKRGSRGCLVLREDQIKKVDKVVSLNQRMPVLIFDKVNYIKPEELSKNQEQITKWLENWKEAWQSKKLKNYMKFYSKNFYSQGKNKVAWYKYKKAINAKVNRFSVNIKNPVIYKNKDQYIVRFLQSYQSSALTDFGEKTLYIRREKNSLKIVNESWAAERKEVLGSLSL